MSCIKNDVQNQYKTRKYIIESLPKVKKKNINRKSISSFSNREVGYQRSFR